MLKASLLVAVFAVAGCGHATATPDLGDTTGVPCADTECAPCADQFCDTADFGKTGMCRAHAAATNQSFGCDGPEDCGGALGACCMIAGIGSACSAAGCGNNAVFMCHDESACAPGEKCCALASGTTYSVCRSSC